MNKINFVLVLVTLFTITKAYAQGNEGQDECTDHRGRLIAHGEHFVPGPDICSLCVCGNGLPMACKAVLCTPPQDCRSLRNSNSTCCEFICLDDDDVVEPAGGLDGWLRMAGGGLLLAVALLTVAVVVCRGCKKKRPHADY